MVKNTNTILNELGISKLFVSQEASYTIKFILTIQSIYKPSSQKYEQWNEISFWVKHAPIFLEIGNSIPFWEIN